MRQGLASLSAISMLLFGDISSAMNVNGPGDSGQASGQRAVKTVINESDYNDWFESARKGNIDKMKSLMRKGIDVNRKAGWCETVLEIAAKWGRADVVDLLLFTTEKIVGLLDMYKNKQRVGDNDLNRHLFGAVEYGETLVGAARGGRTEVVELLLDRGADVNSRDDYGGTALMGAAWNRCTEVVELLLDRGADVNSQDKWGDTALMGAASHGNTEIVKLLLDRGADINSRDKRGGETALMLAVSLRHTEIVRLLLDHGANVNSLDDYGNTAWDYTMEGEDNSEVISLLEEALRKMGR